MTRPPCRGQFFHRLINDACDECGHSLMVHNAQYQCELCQIRTELGLPARAE